MSDPYDRAFDSTAPLPSEEAGALPLRPPLPQTDRYRLEREIGRGGIGRVVQAVDRSIGREVALKLLSEEAPRSARARFEFEGRVTGRLQHPNIVPVHDLGTLSGGREVFFTMKRIHGVDMKRVIEELRDGEHTGTWNTRRLVEALRDVCHAVAYAHARGVIHRDLKPANVMLGAFGEVLLVDWGLAKVVHESEFEAFALPEEGSAVQPALPDAPWVTAEGAILGTPTYMAPEQAAGDQGAVDPRTDVYGLGAILYEVLTQNVPYTGTTTREVIGRVVEGELTAPSEQAQDVDAALEAICLQAMARDPRDRFPTASALADALTGWLEGTAERRRREEIADAALEDGLRLLAEHRARTAEAEGLDAQVKRLEQEIPRHAGPKVKRPLWEAEAARREARALAAKAVGAADAAFGAALAAVPDHPQAREQKCALIHQRYLEAERRGEQERLHVLEQAIGQYDTGGWRRRLQPRGTLSLSTWSYPCACLTPAPAGELAARYGAECDVPWRRGGPAPGEELTDEDLPVPRLDFGDGPSWGHTAACSRQPVAGARVQLFRYVDHEREPRLVLQPVGDLDPTPFGPLELVGGSYLLEVSQPGFAPARLPIRIDRDGAWEQELVLYRADEIPPGFAYVPGGSFLYGEAKQGGRPDRVRETRDVFLARDLVTMAEYAAFLNTLDPEEARARQPRDGETRFLVEEEGRFRAPRSEEESPLRITNETPAIGVSWHDARAYCAWISRRTGRLHRLPHDLELEKAARGVDGRRFPWGERYDGSYSNTLVSHEGAPHPVPVGSFAIDTSPYGLRDMAGNAVSWGLNAGEGAYRHMRVLRGAAFSYSPRNAVTSDRSGIPPERVRSSCSLRPAVPPVRGP